MTTHQANNFPLTGPRAFLAAALCAALQAWPGWAGTISEPSTVFYGRIIGTAAQEPFLIYQGTLTWTIRRPDGTDLVLKAKIRPLNDGQFSYRLQVPHQALASGLAASPDSIALGVPTQTLAHLGMFVDGVAARALGPSGSTFDTAQARRAATYRMDLHVPLDDPDLDGNGLPDGWEERLGLTDPNADGDGDGWNNLAEVRAGADPKHDDRVPSLATKELRAFADGGTALRLRALDSDSPASSLVYTLTRLPESGSLLLRNAGDPDLELAPGAAWTQADVNSGRLVLQHAADPGDALTTSFEVTLQDENPEHPASSNTVFLHLYRPSRSVSLAEVIGASSAPSRLPSLAGFSQDEQPYLMAYALARDLAYVGTDASAEVANLVLAAPSSGLSQAAYEDQYVPAHGHDRSYVMIGGPGGDQIDGGMEADVLVGGPGDDMVRGHGGEDLFIVTSPTDGNDTIGDFDPDQDRLDLSQALRGASLHLPDYIEVESSGGNTILRLNVQGTGAPYASMTLTLLGVSWTAADLESLVENGHLITGNKGFPPRVTILATVAAASENGPTPGQLTLTRTGPTTEALTVNLQVTGSASNGSDYEYLPSQVTFAPGQKFLVLPVVPYRDAITELSEVADVQVLAGTGYLVGSPSRAQVSIADLVPSLSLEILEPLAIKSSQTPAYVLLKREEVLDRSVLARLIISGTAANGVDYQSVPALVNLAPFQTSILIPVLPLPGAVLAGGMEYVDFSIRTDATYALGGVGSARVMIVEEQLTFAAWKARHFPSDPSSLADFAKADLGQLGYRMIERYAFGLDPIQPQDSPGRPSFALRQGRLQVIFRRPFSVTQIEYAVEVSDDLKSWHGDAAWQEAWQDPDYLSRPEYVCHRAVRTVTEAAELFMRVRVTYTP